MSLCSRKPMIAAILLLATALIVGIAFAKMLPLIIHGYTAMLMFVLLLSLFIRSTGSFALVSLVSVIAATGEATLITPPDGWTIFLYILAAVSSVMFIVLYCRHEECDKDVG